MRKRFEKDEFDVHAAYLSMREAEDGLKLLRQAHEAFTRAKAPKTTARIRQAISSAKGAVRNAGYRHTRAQMNANKEK